MNTDFDKFISDYKDFQIRVTKMKDRKAPEMGKGRSGINSGESFVGQASLKYFDESQYGAGFVLMLDGGWTMRTSLVREVVRKSPTRWMLKTMNSIYKVEVAK